jgi:hypothetical protein
MRLCRPRGWTGVAAGVKERKKARKWYACVGRSFFLSLSSPTCSSILAPGPGPTVAHPWLLLTRVREVLLRALLCGKIFFCHGPPKRQQFYMYEDHPVLLPLSVIHGPCSATLRIGVKHLAQ